MSKTRISMRFSNAFEGELIAHKLTVPVGKAINGLSPYEMLLGGLGGCYYATFLDVVKKMRLSFEHCEFDIQGIKREEVPTTLKEVTIDFRVYGAGDEKGFQRAADLAGKYCSIHATVAKVADITVNLHLL